MSSPTRATKVIHETAQRVKDSKVTVKWSDGYSTVSIVSIDPEGGEGTFMQGDEADAFIAEIYALCKRYPSLDENTAALCLAHPYMESWE